MRPQLNGDKWNHLRSCQAERAGYLEEKSIFYHSQTSKHTGTWLTVYLKNLSGTESNDLKKALSEVEPRVIWVVKVKGE